MPQKLSFLVLGRSGARIRQFQFTRFQLAGALLAVAVLMAALGYGIYDYARLAQQAEHGRQAARELAMQNDEVRLQRQQIQNFAKQINALKDHLVKLDAFEQQIRVIANLDQTDTRAGLFGVGGSTPEDLNPNIELTEKHHQLLRQMHRQSEQLKQAAGRQASDFKSMLDVLNAQRNLLASTPAIRPADGWITSRFGYRISPFTGKKEFHKGYDIANRKGSPIMATADGVVSYAGAKGLLGNVVIIDHGHGLMTRYAHIQEALVKKGAKIKRGEVIAKMGNTGRSTGPHVHYEVRLNGLPVNPAKYILN